ncbi:MAG: Uma2 family endonuclease [Treponema sp.]|jgi:Uma2 family endonuclease|nr:Uma2 family endonuclease [Treponema sp.]
MADAAHNEREKRKFTYADYKSWELRKGERFELIYGEAYAMAAPNTAHQRIVMTLAGELYIFLKEKPCEVFAAPFDVRLFYEEDESDDTVVQPDLVVVCDPKKLGPEGCRGAPDMVVEILSPSNTAVEMNLKLKLYLEAQVKEYWMVDPENKHIGAYRLNGGRYIMQSYRKNDTAESAALPGLTIELSALFGP